ncbi:hypothetical protein ZIOFF_021951 [Zingiber officinale]|uniref:Uncharacterized protein n=1 Tax=Zingiber officinale TaxID=94328 RepID=A0A8J5L8X6_ZINOF|nr:hypothetical protein ZIOFF_021951 [Zingiber officinale]
MLYWDIIGLLIFLLSSSRPRDQIPFLGRDIIGLLIFLAFWLSFSRLRDQTPFLGRDIIRLLLSSSRPRDRIPFLGRDIIGLQVKDLKSLSIDLLVPGVLVNAQVTSVLENGIMLSFLIHTSLDMRPAVAAIVSECLVASSFETVRGWDSFKSLLSPSGHMSFWFRPSVHTRVVDYSVELFPLSQDLCCLITGLISSTIQVFMVPNNCIHCLGIPGGITVRYMVS